MSETALRNYLRKIEKDYQGGIATEHTYRPSLIELLEELKPGITATNEPKHIKNVVPLTSLSLKSKTRLVISGHESVANLTTSTHILASRSFYL